MKQAMLILLWSALLLLAALIQPRADALTMVDKIDYCIKYLMRFAPASPIYKNAETRRNLANDIVQGAEEHGQDPFLLTSIFFCESTFNYAALSERDEWGLGQVAKQWRSKCKNHGFDIGKQLGQVRCTSWAIKIETDRCGSVSAGLTSYAGWGRCNTKSERKQWQVKRRLKLAEKLRGFNALQRRLY